MIVYEKDGLVVEKRGHASGRDLRYVVLNRWGREVQAYASLQDAKRLFFGLGLN